ncbi:uncharacterized protein MCYG_05872 [Microsporum canis CBS 113480]|uniref:Uncharacterized protein n=1 Tax=Arthroderma otae (strain ATCC MYA-4605 / CBS 113480) TaxID=554155 RepID=C5FT50_ARTOC|nr:uncharacterized protein MCYG_05872 [Microsporum canis CBS 113480]EEQ33053.1 predicted protein [Microsporum canis CBS 113480]
MTWLRLCVSSLGMKQQPFHILSSSAREIRVGRTCSFAPFVRRDIPTGSRHALKPSGYLLPCFFVPARLSIMMQCNHLIGKVPHALISIDGRPLFPSSDRCLCTDGDRLVP